MKKETTITFRTFFILAYFVLNFACFCMLVILFEDISLKAQFEIIYIDILGNAFSYVVEIRH